MASVIPAPGIGAISGNLGGINFAQTRNGTVARARPSKVNSPSALQFQQRRDFAAAQLAWGALSQAQRRAWNQAARIINIRNRLGLPTTTAGYSLFVSLNANPPGQLPVYYDYPPKPRSTPPVTDLELVATTGPLSILLHWAWQSTPTPNLIRLFGARTFRTYAHHVSNWRELGYFTTIKPNPFPLTPSFVAAWGSPGPGEFIAVATYAWGYDRLPSPTTHASALLT